MRNTILELLHRQPFQPFEVRMSNGDRFEVGHPEMALLSKSNLVIGRVDSDSLDYCALLHVADVRELEQA